MITIPLAEAQSRLSALLDTVQQQPVAITRDGQVAAILVSPQEMPLLQEWQAARIQRREAAAKFEEFFTKTDAHLTPDAESLGIGDTAPWVGEVPRVSRDFD